MSAEVINLLEAPEPSLEAVTAGTIFESSWGYDQTNVDYYQVVGFTPRGWLKFRKIGQEFVESRGSGHDVVMPVVDRFLKDEKPFSRKPRFHEHGGRMECYVTITSYAVASPWSGSSTYQTTPGWGH